MNQEHNEIHAKGIGWFCSHMKCKWPDGEHKDSGKTSVQEFSEIYAREEKLRKGTKLRSKTFTGCYIVILNNPSINIENVETMIHHSSSFIEVTYFPKNYILNNYTVEN